MLQKKVCSDFTAFFWALQRPHIKHPHIIVVVTYLLCMIILASLILIVLCSVVLVTNKLLFIFSECIELSSCKHYTHICILYFFSTFNYRQTVPHVLGITIVYKLYCDLYAQSLIISSQLKSEAAYTMIYINYIFQ